MEKIGPDPPLNIEKFLDPPLGKIHSALTANVFFISISKQEEMWKIISFPNSIHLHNYYASWLKSVVGSMVVNYLAKN